MEQDKLIQKTNELIKKQNEVNTTLHEIRKEVLNTRDMNRNLAAENSRLRKLLNTAMNEKAITEVKTEVKVEEVLSFTEKLKDEVLANPVIEFSHEKEAEKLDKKIFADTSISKSAIYEFFLGKNVISKIGALMISLGIFTFGRIAYIRWMDDLERFIFIFAIGILFLVVGHFFDRNKSEVFSVTFYGVGLTAWFLSMVLVITYNVFETFPLLIINFILIGAVFVYFKRRRGVLLDFLIVAFYLFLGMISSYGYLESNELLLTGIVYYATVLVIFGIIGHYILFIYNKKPLHFLFTYLSVMGFVTIISLIFVYFESQQFVIWNIGLILLTYLGNYVYMNKIKNLNPLLGIQTILTIIANVTVVYLMFINFNNINMYIVYLYIAIVLLPIYVYLYRDKVTLVSHTVDSYGIIIAGFIMLFIFYYFNESETNYSNWIVKNILFLSLLIVSFVVAKFSKRITHYVILIGVAVGYILSFSIGIEDLFKVSFEFAGYYIPTIIIVMGLVIGDAVYNNINKQENNAITYVIQSILFLTFSISLLMITRSFRDAILPRYTLIYFTSLVYFMISYKEIFTTKYFIKDKEKLYRNVINIIIILAVVLINVNYFNHDFSKGLDIFAFFMVLLPNLYIIYSLKEIYNHALLNKNYKDEWVFIILFKIGVIVQALFITYFINFTYDKVLLSSYFMIVAAIGVLFGFKEQWKNARYIGLAAIYFSFIKFFVYDFFKQDLTDTVKVVTYITLGIVLFGISFLYSSLEKTYGGNEIVSK